MDKPDAEVVQGISLFWRMVIAYLQTCAGRANDDNATLTQKYNLNKIK